MEVRIGRHLGYRALGHYRWGAERKKSMLAWETAAKVAAEEQAQAIMEADVMDGHIDPLDERD